MERPAALITGAASGIGLAVAEEFARRGYELTLLDLDARALVAAEARVAARGARVLPVAADVTDAAAQAAAFRQHMQRYGRLDVALLNAGIGERGDFLNLPPGDLDHHRTLDVDLTAVVDGFRLAAHAMGAAGLGGAGGAAAGSGARGGCIITVASAAGVFPVPAGPIYAAAKGGLVHFVRSLAPRLAARGVAAAAVCPQYVDTPLVRGMLRDTPEVARAMMGPLYGQPLLEPKQVAAVVWGVVEGHLRAREQGGGGGGGSGVLLLLQDGKVVDPFARRARGGGGGAGGAQRPQAAVGAPQPHAHVGGGGSGVSGTASLARWPPAALRAYVAPGRLPGSFRKLQVARLSTDFRAAVRAVEVPMPRLPGGLGGGGGGGGGGLPDGAVLVRRLYAGVNASDINYTSGRYHGSAAAAQRALPYDAGFESVGVVVATGPGVTGLAPGAPVAAMDGGFSEFGVHPANRLLPVPAPTPEVLALLTSGLTASLALEQAAGLALPPPFAPPHGVAAAAPGAAGGGERPRTVLVTAAAGGTGQFAVQLAKLSGCRVVATCGGAGKAALLARLGADRVINYREEDVKAVLKAEFPGGMDVVYESVGGKMFDIAVDALADRGTLVVIGMMSAYGDGWKPSSHTGLAEKLLWKSARVAGFFLLRYAPLWGPHLAALIELTASGRLHVAVDGERFSGLDGVPAAVDRLQSGASSGKVVVQVAAELPAAAAAAAKL